MRDVRRMTTREPSLQSNVCSMCFCSHSCTAAVRLLPTWLTHHRSHAQAKCSFDSPVSLFFRFLASPQADAHRDQSYSQDTHLRLSPFLKQSLQNQMRSSSNLGGLLLYAPVCALGLRHGFPLAARPPQTGYLHSSEQ